MPYLRSIFLCLFISTACIVVGCNDTSTTQSGTASSSQTRVDANDSPIENVSSDNTNSSNVTAPAEETVVSVAPSDSATADVIPVGQTAGLVRQENPQEHGTIEQVSATGLSPPATSDEDGGAAGDTQRVYPSAYYKKPDFIVEGPERAIRVSYDDLDLLKIMDSDPVPLDVGKRLPPRIRDLDGRRVRLRGFMFPPFAPDGLTGFVLARDNEICCFGRSPKIYDIIPVELRPTVTTRYIEGRPFDVVGVLHVDPDDDGDELFQLFYIDDAIVIE